MINKNLLSDHQLHSLQIILSTQCTYTFKILLLSKLIR